jgi:hypothetical protein
VIALAAGALCAALTVVAVLAMLRAPLLAVLTELCLGEPRARFWWRVVTIELSADTALCASLAMLLVSRAQSWRTVAVTLQGGIAGLLLSLVAVMLAVLAFERERDRSREDPAG